MTASGRLSHRSALYGNRSTQSILQEPWGYFILHLHECPPILYPYLAVQVHDRFYRYMDKRALISLPLDTGSTSPCMAMPSDECTGGTIRSDSRQNFVEQRRNGRFLIGRHDYLITRVFKESHPSQLRMHPVLNLRVLCQQEYRPRDGQGVERT